MATSRELVLIIKAQDKATAELRKVNKTLGEMDRKTKSSSKSMRTSLRGVGAAVAIVGTAFIVAGVAVFNVAKKFAFAAARVSELELVLGAVAKANDVSSDSATNTVTKLRDYNIAHKQALEITTLFMQAQLDLDDAIKLGNVAKDLAVIGAMDSSQATQILIEATASQSIMMLRQFGIITNLSEIYEIYGESVGKTSDQLTDQEKKQAFLNKILMEGSKVVGTYEAAMGSVSKRYRSLTGRIIPDFIAEVGKAFEPSMIVMVDEVTKAIAEMSEWVENNKEQISIWGKQLSAVTITMTTEIIPTVKSVIKTLKENEETVRLVIDIFKALGTVVKFVVIIVIGFIKILHAVFEAMFLAIFLSIQKFEKMWNHAKATIKAVVDAMTGNFKNMKLLIVGDLLRIKQAWQILKDLLNKGISAVIKIKEKVTKSSRDDDDKKSAVGGSIMGGATHLVGERGPELFTPSTGGTITPANKTAQMGSETRNFNFNFSGATIIDREQFMQEIRETLNREQELYQMGAL